MIQQGPGGIVEEAFTRVSMGLIDRRETTKTHQPRGIMRPMDKATADSCSVQSFTTGLGNFVIGRFQARARNGLSV